MQKRKDAGGALGCSGGFANQGPRLVGGTPPGRQGEVTGVGPLAA